MASEDTPTRDLKPSGYAQGLRDLTKAPEFLPGIQRVQVIDSVERSMPLSGSPTVGWHQLILAPGVGLWARLAVLAGPARGMLVEWVSSDVPFHLDGFLAGTFPAGDPVAAYRVNYQALLPGRVDPAAKAVTPTGTGLTAAAQPGGAGPFELNPRATFGSTNLNPQGPWFPAGAWPLGIWLEMGVGIGLTASAENAPARLSLIGRVPLTPNRLA